MTDQVHPVSHELAPGHYEFRIVAWTEGEDPEDVVSRQVIEETRRRFGRDPGYSLAEMREKLNVLDGVVPDPMGVKHRVSLEPWRDADPETTRLMHGFRFVPDDRGQYLDAMRSWRESDPTGPPGA